MITDETGKEYPTNRRQIHLTQEPPTTLGEYLNDVSDSVRPCLHGGRVTLLEGLPSSIVFPGFVYMRGRVTPGGG